MHDAACAAAGWGLRAMRSQKRALQRGAASQQSHPIHTTPRADSVSGFSHSAPAAHLRSAVRQPSPCMGAWRVPCVPCAMDPPLSPTALAARPRLDANDSTECAGGLIDDKSIIKKKQKTLSVVPKAFLTGGGQISPRRQKSTMSVAPPCPAPFRLCASDSEARLLSRAQGGGRGGGCRAGL